MPLTKNLYREDEVLASLKFCVLKGRAQEAIFWAQEALDSGMRDDVLESLLWVWVLAATTVNAWWLVNFREAVQKGTPTDEEVQYLVMCLARSPQTLRDATALALLGLGLRQECWADDRVGMPKLPTFTRELSKRELTAVRAMEQGKAPLAWGLLIPEWTRNADDIWDILKVCCGSSVGQLIHLLQTAPSWFPARLGRRWVWPLRAAAVALTCWPPGPKPIAPFEAPIEWVAYRYQWMSNPMRYRRLFPPQQLALFWFTERGQLGTAQSTERELMEHLEEGMRGSIYWEPRVPELTASDESREDFYTKYFPNDIPDEWTSPDRQVSHGRGVISDPANTDWSLKFETALNTWFGALPCHLWQGLNGAFRGIFVATRFDPKTHRPSELFTTIADAYDELREESYAHPLLEPVKREFVVV